MYKMLYFALIKVIGTLMVIQIFAENSSWTIDSIENNT